MLQVRLIFFFSRDVHVCGIVELQSLLRKDPVEIFDRCIVEGVLLRVFKCRWSCTNVQSISVNIFV